MIRPNPAIADMSAYTLAQMRAPAGKRLISLAQNESLRPPSPRAIDAAQRVLRDGALYPDPDWTALRAVLAARHDLRPDRILCGAGSLDLIGCLARVYAGPARPVLAPAHSYPFFRSAAQMAGAPYHEAPLAAGLPDIEGLVAATTDETALLFLANPGNPTGTRVPNEALRALRRALPAHVLLVIDEAYGEFSEGDEAACFDMAGAGDTVILRTFSKAYGLAGFRVGWGVFREQVAEQVRKVMNPNNISAASQAAAYAAAQDAAYMAETCTLTAQLRDAAAEQLRGAGYQVAPSYTNFLMIDCKTPAFATGLDRHLQAEGIFLRAQGGAGLPHCLRMTIGPKEDTYRAVDRLVTAPEEIIP